MAGRADAGDADRCLVGIGLEPGDQPLQIVRRQAVLADDQQRLAADLDDRLEILQQVERQRVEPAGQHMRGRGADAQRVAVGGRHAPRGRRRCCRRRRRRSRSRRAGRARPASARREIAPAYRWRRRRKRHDHGDRPRRIILRGGDPIGARPSAIAIIPISHRSSAPPLSSVHPCEFLFRLFCSIAGNKISPIASRRRCSEASA